MELTYENMMEFMKKFWDIMFTMTPDTKDKFREFLAGDFRCTYVQGRGREGEVGHVASHHDRYRAACLYEPPPLGIFIDERKKVATTLLHEEARHPATGEPVKEWRLSLISEPVSDLYLVCIHELTLVDNQIKLKSERVSFLNHSRMFFD